MIPHRTQPRKANSELEPVRFRLDPPHLLEELIYVTSRTDVPLPAIVAILKRTPDLAESILQRANAVQRGLDRPFTDLQRAVAFLGLDLVQKMVHDRLHAWRFQKKVS